MGTRTQPSSRRGRAVAAWVGAVGMTGAAGAATAPATPPGRTATIAVTNQAAGGGGTYASFNAPSVSDSGHVAFFANYNQTFALTGLYTGLGEGGTVGRVLNNATTAPEGNGSFSTFDANSLTMNGVGGVAFYANLSGTAGGAADATGLYARPGASGAISQVARQGQAAPDGNGKFGDSFGTIHNLSFTFNGAGTVAFRTDLTNTAGGTTDNAGIYRWNAGSAPVVVARKGAPDFGGSTKYEQLTVPYLNDAGAMAFSNQTASGSSFVYRTSPLRNDLIAYTGQTAPDGLPYGPTMSVAGLTSNGEVYIHSAGGSSNLYYHKSPFTPGGVVLRMFGPPPDGDGTITGLFTPFRMVNSRGDEVTGANLTGTHSGPDESSILWYSGGSLKVAARAGQAAPDGNGILQIQDYPAGGEAPFAVFVSGLSNTAGGAADNQGLFLSNGTEMVQAIRKGQALAGSTVTSVTTAFQNASNSFGQVAYKATLADGRQGVFLFTPELHWRDATGGSWDDANHWTLTLDPGPVHDVKIDPAGSITVFGPTASETVKSLQVGGGAGVATLRLQGGSTLSATGGVTVTPTGVLTGDGAVVAAVTNNGTVTASNLTVTAGNVLTNNGLVTGNGRLNAAVTNAASGTIRAEAGQRLALGGSVTSAGHVDVLGGSLDVAGTLNNSGPVLLDGGGLTVGGLLTNQAAGRISGRGLLRAAGSLSNSGQVNLTGGVTDVEGNVANLAGGKVIVTGASVANFYNDVANNGEVRVSDGSTAVFFGTVTGAGSYTGTGRKQFEGTFSPGNSPALVSVEGDLLLGEGSTTRMEIGGLTEGSQHDKLAVAGTIDAGGALEVVLLNGFVPAAGDRFDLFDFGNLNGQFARLSLPALGDGLGWDTSALYASGEVSVVVPEPAAAAALALLGAGALAARRRRRG